MKHSLILIFLLFTSYYIQGQERLLNNLPLVVENTAVINKLSSETFTTDFATGEKTVLNYPKAKIIDMYGFFYGQ